MDLLSHLKDKWKEPVFNWKDNNYNGSVYNVQNQFRFFQITNLYNKLVGYCKSFIISRIFTFIYWILVYLLKLKVLGSTSEHHLRHSGHTLLYTLSIRRGLTKCKAAKHFAVKFFVKVHQLVTVPTMDFALISLIYISFPGKCLEIVKKLRFWYAAFWNVSSK